MTWNYCHAVSISGGKYPIIWRGISYERVYNFSKVQLISRSILGRVGVFSSWRDVEPRSIEGDCNHSNKHWASNTYGRWKTQSSLGNLTFWQRLWLKKLGYRSLRWGLGYIRPSLELVDYSVCIWRAYKIWGPIRIIDICSAWESLETSPESYELHLGLSRSEQKSVASSLMKSPVPEHRGVPGFDTRWVHYGKLCVSDSETVILAWSSKKNNQVLIRKSARRKKELALE